MPTRGALCRDKSVIVWTLTKEEGVNYGFTKKRLKGHSHFVQDVVISSDGQFALSGSWDGTLRLWNLTTGATTRRFLGHTKDVLSVAFSVDNRQVPHHPSQQSHTTLWPVPLHVTSQRTTSSQVGRIQEM